MEEPTEFEKHQVKLISRWGSINPVLSFIDLVLQKKWRWIKNSKCKYVNLRIDTRDLSCIIEDRHGNEITIEQLLEQSV